MLEDLYNIALFLSASKFWKAQVTQVYLNQNLEYEIIPRVGSHQIILGGADDLQYKFRKLEALYLKAFKVVGWNEYETINLKFGNQVICTKR
ncbi:MAG: hypothetical protein HC896_00705 [Bacteroidales bacterium]|nr:hypothetical protein [Bacteroidales bacterium]